MKNIPGYIQWVRSSQKNQDFPVLVYSADVDFVTTGMVSLTSTERNEVVATTATTDEWNNYDLQSMQARINQLLTRADLRCTRLIRSEGGRLVYADLFLEGAEAFSVHTQTLKEFKKNGGIVTLFQFK